MSPASKPAASPAGEHLVGAFAKAPRTGIAPLWVHYSGISPAARALVAPLLDGALRVHGDQAPTLNREFLAWVLGVNRHDKGVQAALDELVSIGFLTIYDGGVHPETGKRMKRRDPATRQVLPDIYTVCPDAPDNYLGPRNVSEAYEAFRHDRDEAYAAHEATGRKGLVSIRRTSTGRLENPQVRATPFTGGVATPPVKGVDPFSQVSPSPFTEGVASPFTGGVGENPQVRATPFTGGVQKEREKEGERDLSGLSRLTEGATAGPASPSAAPQEPAVADEVRELVRRLPWEHYGHKLRRTEAAKVAAAVQAAVARGDLTLIECEETALRAMAASDIKHLPSWVAGAFQPENLLEPLSDDPLAPLASPVAADPEVPPVAAPVPPARLPACLTCRTPEGGARPQRVVPAEGGRSVPCPECRAEDHAQHLARTAG